MIMSNKETLGVVRMPDGMVLSRADLPDPHEKRWVASRKMVVVRAVLYGVLSLDDALKRSSLSEEEFFTWVEYAACHGEAGLKTTQLKKNRQL